MAEAPMLPEEVRQTVLGRESEPVVVTVERGAIQRFAEAIGDENPLWCDDVRARRSRYGGIIAPPTFLRSVQIGQLQVPELDSLTRVLDGGSEWHYAEPVRVGDVITGLTKLVNLSQRTLSFGPAVFVVAETTYTNQLGEMVARQRSTLIRY